MPLLSKLSSFWRNLFHKAQIEQDLDEEVRSYIEMLTEENIKTGKSPEEARRAALIEFGGLDQVKEQVRDVRVFLETLWYDLRYAACSLAKSRGFTAVAVLTLALGIGGTTMIFSLIYCGMLDPFPYADSRRLMVLISRNLSRDRWALVSPTELKEYDWQNHVFDEVIGSKYEDVLLTRLDAPPRFLQATRVTGNYFSVLRVRPLIGRPLFPGDGRPDAPPVAVLSEMIWERDFGRDPDIVGRTVVLNHQSTTVVGVMPSRLALFNAHIWLPQTPATDPNTDQWQYYSLIGRLKPGVSIKEAKADVAVLSRQFATEKANQASTFNAKAETLTERPAYRNALLKRRCVVPVEAFYEWVGPPKRDRQPLNIERADGKLLSLAGLFNYWKPAASEGRPMLTFTVVTTAPSKWMARIHNRMPVILQDSQVDTWLDPTVSDPQQLGELLKAPPEDFLDCYPVSREMSSVRADQAEYAQRIDADYSTLLKDSE